LIIAYFGIKIILIMLTMIKEVNV